MDENELRRKAGLENVPVGILEKDYVLSVMLLNLGKEKILDDLVFKGGTAIKKIYHPETRFSDLEELEIPHLSRSETLERI